jgi:predicted nucleotidyltransferase
MEMTGMMDATIATARAALSDVPHRVLFATLSGSHLYGFDSPDSDVDVRGMHAAPVASLLSLKPDRETIEVMAERDGFEIDLVTHEARKYLALLVKGNVNSVDQIVSPLVVITSEWHRRLAELLPRVFSKAYANPYRGLARTQWTLMKNGQKMKIKSLLYVYRALLGGILLMRTGVPEPNLRRLNETFRLMHVDELIERKASTAELAYLPDAEFRWHLTEYERLLGVLDEETARSPLPDRITEEALAEVNRFLLDLRADDLRSRPLAAE